MYITVLIMISMGALGSMLIQQQLKFSQQQSNDFGRIIADQLALAASEPLLAHDLFALRGLLSRQNKHTRILGVSVLDYQADTIAREGINALLYIGKITEKSIHHIQWQSSDKGRILVVSSFISPIYFKNTLVGYALVSLDDRILQTQKQHWLNGLLVAMLGLMIIATLMAFALARKLAEPIRSLALAGEAIEKGVLETRLAHKRCDELGNIFKSFNQLAEGMCEKGHIEQTFYRY
ncbi:MAG: HAMP domain-containing protein [gamma proteobacterium symbiont of Bathyaustriella thionipta]|nr:HAMP domain-containing protein [gamma proteobacterium symbiont of Bathyaustriella thionipta]